MALNNVQQTMFQQGTTEDVAIGAASTQSTIFTQNTAFYPGTPFSRNASGTKVLLQADVDCRVLAGANPTAAVATGGGTRIPANGGLGMIIRP